MKPFPGQIIIGKYKEYILTDEQREWFANAFPYNKNEKVAKAMGIAMSSMHRLARKYGLKKDGKWESRMRRSNAKKITRRLEASGYYDSIRGKPMPKECTEAFRRYLDSDRYRHPMTILKEDNPREYRKKVKARSEHRKKLMQEERKRQRLGLRRKSSMHIPPDVYKASQTNHRHNAYLRGYIIPDKTDLPNRWCIWYDSATDRSERFESNCVKDGFKVLPLPGEEQEEQNKRDENWNRYNQLFN